MESPVLAEDGFEQDEVDDTFEIFSACNYDVLLTQNVMSEVPHQVENFSLPSHRLLVLVVSPKPRLARPAEVLL